jgi:outer membrane immunogenic protein
MKKFLLGTVGLIAAGMASPALAADMAVKAPPPPPAPLPVIYNWSGFYIGANGGWGQSHNCLDLFTDVFGTVTGCRDRSGGVFGGQIGYRWQTNQFVFGLEAQGDWADLSNTRVSVFDPFLSTTVKTDAIGLFTGQLGWAWNNSLLYFKGGAAVTRNRLDVFDNTFGIGLFSASNTRWGGTAGVGWEYGFSPNWSVGVEYDHLWMGHADNNFAAVTTPGGFLLTGDRISQDVDMVTVRFNYRFGGWGAPPVAARY